MSFKAPDRLAPRFRPKKLNMLNVEMFKAFLKDFPEYKGKVDHKGFKKIVTDHCELIQDNIISHRDGVELPESLGIILVVSCESHRPQIDIKKSIEYGKAVKFRNYDSDGRLAKILYSNYGSKYQIKDRQLWMFQPVRQFKHKVSKAYVKNYTKYIQLDHKTRISSMYNNRKRKETAIKFYKDHIDEYKDFEI